jgi:hypothetical protein
MTATLTWTTSCHEHICQILLPYKLFAFLCSSLRHSLRHSAWAGLDLNIKTKRKEGKKKKKETMTITTHFFVTISTLCKRRNQEQVAVGKD